MKEIPEINVGVVGHKGKKYDKVVWYHCTRGDYYVDSRGSIISSKYINKETLTVKEDVYRFETIDKDTAEEKLSLSLAMMLLIL